MECHRNHRNLKQHFIVAWSDVQPGIQSLWFRSFAVGLILVTIAAMVCDMATGLLVNSGKMSEQTASWFRLSQDWSVWETIGYGYWQAAAVLTFIVARRIASPVHYFLAGLFQFLVADDALQFHERAGEAFGALLFAGAAEATSPSITDVAANDYGELVYAAIVVTIMLTGLVLCARNSTGHQAAMGVMLAMPLALVAAGAVGIDFLQQFIPVGQRVLRGGVATLENGIELLGASLVLLAASLQWQTARTGPSQ